MFWPVRLNTILLKSASYELVIICESHCDPRHDTGDWAQTVTRKVFAEVAEEWAKSQASFFCYSHRTRPLVAITKNAPAQRWKLHSWLLLGCSLSVGIGTDLLLPDRTSLWQPEVLKLWILGKTCLCVARMLVQGRVISVTEKFGLFLFQNRSNHRGRRWWLLSLFFFFFFCTVVLSACSSVSSREKRKMKTISDSLKLYSSVTRCFTSLVVHTFVGRTISPWSHLKHL